MRMWLVLLFAIGLAIFGLGFTDFPLSIDPLLSFISNVWLSRIVGALFILFVVWRWFAGRKKRKLTGPRFGGGGAVSSKEEALRYGRERVAMDTRRIKRIKAGKAREAENIRAAHAMEFKRDPRYAQGAT